MYKLKHIFQNFNQMLLLELSILKIIIYLLRYKYLLNF